VEYVGRWDGYEGIELFCSVGVHPHEASSYEGIDADKFICDMVSHSD
jgi:hypothetical protein